MSQETELKLSVRADQIEPLKNHPFWQELVPALFANWS